jgi:hypothetical protein
VDYSSHFPEKIGKSFVGITLEKDGQIQLGGLPSGTYSASVTSTQFAGQYLQDIFISPERCYLKSIVFSEGGRLKVEVMGHAGQPISGKKVSLNSEQGYPLYTAYLGDYDVVYTTNSLYTDADGKCIFERIPAGVVHVRVENANVNDKEHAVTVENGILQVLQIELNDQ